MKRRGFDEDNLIRTVYCANTFRAGSPVHPRNLIEER